MVYYKVVLICLLKKKKMEIQFANLSAVTRFPANSTKISAFFIHSSSPPWIESNPLVMNM